MVTPTFVNIPHTEVDTFRANASTETFKTKLDYIVYRHTFTDPSATSEEKELERKIQLEIDKVVNVFITSKLYIQQPLCILHQNGRLQITTWQHCLIPF